MLRASGRFPRATLTRPVVFAPILRAGLGLLEGMLRLLPQAAVGHIGLYRDEVTLRPVNYYCRLPAGLAGAQVLLLDPMLATGYSACEAVTLLKCRAMPGLSNCKAHIPRCRSSAPRLIPS